MELRMESEEMFKQTEIGNIPKDWDLSKVGDIARINEVAITKTFPYDEIEYVDIDSVENGIIRNVQRIRLKEAPSRAKRIVKSNDIIISTVRPNLRHFALINQSKPNTIVSTGFAVISAKKVNPKFLYYYLTTEKYTNYLTAIADAHTSAYPSFNPDLIENSLVPLPEREEQDRIAKILFDIDTKIELNQQMNKSLEAIGQALFKHWFVDFEFPNEKGKPYKSSGGKMVDSELGEIPNGWGVKNLGEVIELAYGKGLSENRRKDGKYPVVGSSGIVGFHDEYLVKGPGIVIGRKGTIGEVIWIDRNFFPIDTTFYVISKIDKVNLYYFYYLLLTQDFPKIGSDSAVPGLNRNFAYMNLIIVPPTDLINKFDNICKSLFEMMALKKEEISVLGRVCDSLLPKLMSGQIRVPAG